MSKRPSWQIGAGLCGLLVLGALGGTHALRAMVWDAMRPRTLPTPAVPTGLQSRSAAACGACHGEIHAEWAASRMASAMQNTAFLVDWAANDHMPTCLSCHAPFQAQQPEVVHGIASVLPELTFDAEPNPGFDPQLQQEGVTCLACHLPEEGEIGGVNDDVLAPHGVRVEPGLRAGDICTRCHQMVNSPLFDLDRPVIDTVGEHTQWRAATGSTLSCVDCHMSAVERPSVPGGPVRQARRHDFHGGWDEDTLRAAIALGPLRQEGAELVVAVHNRAGHRFPTGETSVAVEIVFSTLDAAGASTPHSTQLLTRVVEGPRFHDVIDTTLLPDETRTLRLPLEPEVLAAARGARVAVRYERYANLPAVRAHAEQAGLPTRVEIAAVESRW